MPRGTLTVDILPEEEQKLESLAERELLGDLPDRDRRRLATLLRPLLAPFA